MNSHCNELKKLFIAKQKQRFDKQKMIGFTKKLMNRSQCENILVNLQITKLQKNCGANRNTKKPHCCEEQTDYKCLLIAKPMKHVYDYDYVSCDNCEGVCEYCCEQTNTFSCDDFSKCFEIGKKYMEKYTNCKGCCDLLCNVLRHSTKEYTFTSDDDEIRNYVTEFEKDMNLNNIIIGSDTYCVDCTNTILFENTNSFCCVVCKEEKLEDAIYIFDEDSCNDHTNKMCKLCAKKTNKCSVCNKKKLDPNE